MRDVMMREGFPKLLIANHQSGDTHLFQLAFSDTYVTGEHLTGNADLVRDLAYYRVLDYDDLRAECLWTNLGIPIIFLPEILRGVQGDKAKEARVLGPEGIAPAEHLCGMLWVHDIIAWNAYLNPEPIRQAIRAKRAFGWDDQTRFVGYWDSAKLVGTQAPSEQVRTSVFLRPGRALFVVMNNSDQPAEVTLTPDWAALGVTAPADLTDLYAQAAAGGARLAPPAPAVPIEGGIIKLTVKARSFRALATPQP